MCIFGECSLSLSVDLVDPVDLLPLSTLLTLSTLLSSVLFSWMLTKRMRVISAQPKPRATSTAVICSSVKVLVACTMSLLPLFEAIGRLLRAS